MESAAKEYKYIDVSIIKNKDEILSKTMYDYMFTMIGDEVTRKRFEYDLIARAEQLRCKTEVKSLIKEYKKQYANSHYCTVTGSGEPLKINENGNIATTENNFETILRNDEEFMGLKFNEVSGMPEDKMGEEWTDLKDKTAMSYIERNYGIYSPEKYTTASTVVFGERVYNPIKDIIEGTTWDGLERIPTFLNKWMKCDDTPYTREVSRLIFAGGINRLYNPGCKFDEMPVLVGSQGSGKSTLTRWIAIEDRYFVEIIEFDGQKGIEILEGKWVCEVSELLALTKAKEKEAVKSYLSRLEDVYRRPFERRVSRHPRRVIFVATTNKDKFLTDKTGNRRMYPVEVHQTAKDLFEHETQCKADILQCWAEAKAKYDKKEMPSYADYSLLEEIKKVQADAMEDDYRVGMIGAYLKDKDKTCVIELWELALHNYSKPSRMDSNDIALIMQSMEEWEKSSKAMRFSVYGIQKGWTKKKKVEPVQRKLY